MDSNQSYLIRESTFTLLIKVFGIGSSIGFGVILARNLGADGVGLISFSNRVFSILMIVAMLGINQTVTRKIATIADPQEYRRFLKIALQPAIFMSSLILILVFCLADFISVQFLTEKRFALVFKFFAVAMIVQVIGRIYGAALNGSKLIWQSSLVENNLANLLSLLLIILGLILGFADNFLFIILVITGCRILACGGIISYCRKIWPDPGTKIISAKYSKKKLIRESRPLCIAALLTNLSENFPFILLSTFASVGDLGTLGVCFNISFLGAIILQAVSSTMAPIFSDYHKRKDLESMVNLLTKVNFFLFFSGGSCFLILYYQGQNILGFWGEEFIQGFDLLLILAAGQFFNIATGLCGTILVMTGFGRLRKKIAYATLLISIILGAILIPYHGITGAAIALSLTLVLDNLMKMICVRIKLKIKTSIVC